jgi:hypothetical protein
VLRRVAAMPAQQRAALVMGGLISSADGVNQAPVSLTVN